MKNGSHILKTKEENLVEKDIFFCEFVVHTAFYMNARNTIYNKLEPIRILWNPFSELGLSVIGYEIRRFWRTR